MREITTHVGNGLNDSLRIHVLDEPGSGNASHVYGISFPNSPLTGTELPPNSSKTVTITFCFQNGPIKEVGVNGETHEALTAILIDRLRGFQAGPYACDDNAEALAHYEAALECLQRRTRARIARGVEGSHAV